MACHYRDLPKRLANIFPLFRHYYLPIFKVCRIEPINTGFQSRTNLRFFRPRSQGLKFQDRGPNSVSSQSDKIGRRKRRMFLPLRKRLLLKQLFPGQSPQVLFVPLSISGLLRVTVPFEARDLIYAGRPIIAPSPFTFGVGTCTAPGPISTT